MSERPITIEIIETIRYRFELNSDDLTDIFEGGDEFTHERVRAWAIDLYETAGVDKDHEGYQVAIDFDFTDEQRIDELRAGASDEQ